MVTKEGIRIKFRNKIYIPLTNHIRNKKLKNKDFTIISNNCWAGTVYEAYNIIKKTPTVGMFIMPDDYIKLCKNLREYLNKDMIFIDYNDSKYHEELKSNNKFGTYPIAKLGDIELHLLHYENNPDKIIKKWQRRIARINWDNIIFKFNDQNGCTEKHLKEFLNLPYEKKVFFTCKQWNVKSDKIVMIKQRDNKDFIFASREPFAGKNFKLIKYYIEK